MGDIGYYLDPAEDETIIKEDQDTDTTMDGETYED